MVDVEAGVSPAGKPGAAETAATTPVQDLTPGDHDVPPFNLRGQAMYAISPDGQELAYTSNIDEVEATSTGPSYSRSNGRLRILISKVNK